MRNGLGLKWVISGSFLLLIAVVLLIYSLLLPEYSVRGLLYTASAMMEEEAQYFARHYKKDPNTPPPHNYFYTSVIGKEALPEKIRQMLDTPPSLSFGAVQAFGDLESDDEDEGRVVLAQPLSDGKTLYMYDVDHDKEEGGEVETPLSDAYIERELRGVNFISLAVFVPALIIIALLVWWLVRPLGRLAQWSSTLKDADAVSSQRPSFGFKEFNMLADALAQSVQQVQAASLREGRLLRYTSHELRTPLAVLKANIELLTLQSGGVLPPPLQRIERSVLNMQRIAETLLWMSRELPEPLPEEPIDMSGLVTELIEEHRYLIGTRDIELLLDISSTPCRLPLTACRIVVGNFLRNALQYADEGSVEINFDYPQLRIVNRIREAKQLEPSNDFGYGLGLELMRQLSARLGWRIEVLMEQQRFTVTLDFNAAPPAEELPAPQSAPEA
ncbi:MULTISPECIES: sensor histidine kinase [Pseudomonas]|uniref:histidine kinase n=4 Tax=Pseudomonas TaxID=286 RepID=A0A9Q6IGV2_9PSED|nr:MULTISPECIES: HAMP domain-containing sensor histidine kinase [Pseudomonas]MBS7561492.1 HAMP domain-containing histidine kinase [Pseudomonas sp. RC4D1]MBW8358017.1 HAMP domain-containing histidine kinase [Pseudomonas sp.]MCY7263265.1 HAMP domain-containing histidine kinase [Pseudomonas protegens]MDC7817232.1 HAMP domain-containing sensor histidine kinase [Pseudomonas sp. BLCC-B112]MDD1019108.1 HAMP domain-containing histidine kinase [Pseudomonas idahonensis]